MISRDVDMISRDVDLLKIPDRAKCGRRVKSLKWRLDTAGDKNPGRKPAD
jgi:hypothetical protein